MHMQGNNVPNFNGTPLPGSWEIAVVNGTYTVTVGRGRRAGQYGPGEPHDQRRRPERHQRLRAVRGRRQRDAAQPRGSKTVTVADGRLTVDATGGTNTKINYIDIAPGECVSTGDAAVGPKLEPGQQRDERGARRAGHGRGHPAQLRRHRSQHPDLVDGPAVPGQHQHPGVRHGQQQRRRRRDRPPADGPRWRPTPSTGSKSPTGSARPERRRVPAVHEHVHDRHQRRRHGRRHLHRLVREGGHLGAGAGRRHRLHRRRHRPRRQAVCRHELRRDQALHDQRRRHARPRAEHHHDPDGERRLPPAHRHGVRPRVDGRATRSSGSPTTSSRSTTRPTGRARSRA